MSGKGKLTSLLMQKNLDKKKIVEYGRSRKLDVDELIIIAVRYTSMVAELGPYLNPLHVACIRNRPDIVMALIQEGYNLNEEVGRIDSYLRIALDFGNIAVAHLLLELGADAHTSGAHGKTPIEAALSKNKREKTCVSAVKLLLEAGVSVNAVAISDTQEKPLHLAVNNNLPLAVSFLLQKGADGNITEKQGCTPLHHACYKNLVEIIKLLTLHKVELYIENMVLDTPLLILVRRFFKEGITALVNGGCDINKPLVSSSCSALHYVVKECHVEKVKYLLSLGADPNKYFADGESPLHVLAARVRAQTIAEEKPKTQASLDILEVLVEKGANVNATSTDKNTPLLLALKNKHFKLAKQLIKLGANPNFKLPFGKILFHDIASLNQDIITLSLDYGADYYKKNGACLTPYHFAITGKVDVRFIKSFIQFGCPYNQYVSVWDKSRVRGSGEFNQFVKAEEQFFKGLRENNLTLVQKAVESGAVPTGSSDECRHPLHFVALNGFKEILKFLLENAFPANALNSEGETALFVAAKQGHYDICFTLLQFGACYNYHSKKCSKTPLIVAVEFEHESIVELLKRVHRMFRFAISGRTSLIEDLKRMSSSLRGEYLMYVNAINIHGNSLLSTTLRSKHSGNAKKMMELRNLTCLNK